MKRIYLFLFTLSSMFANCQIRKDSILEHIQKEQQELIRFYLDSTTTPLSMNERNDFEGIKYFEIDLKYRVVAKVERFKIADTVIFQTSSSKKKKYIKYANLRFKLDGKKHLLVVYKMAGLIKAEYANLLFLPFTDLTSNNTSYGGGRYLDLEIPMGNSMVIDFNLCYQPYCAYSHNGWSCPIPPKENFVNALIKAGVKN